MSSRQNKTELAIRRLVILRVWAFSLSDAISDHVARSLKKLKVLKLCTICFFMSLIPYSYYFSSDWKTFTKTWWKVGAQWNILWFLFWSWSGKLLLINWIIFSYMIYSSFSWIRKSSTEFVSVGSVILHFSIFYGGEMFLILFTCCGCPFLPFTDGWYLL